ncbi:MAG: hypothetical protein CM1200mP30_05030 [Pseudomonadota bacterium]|nr:MAG: hypothetical protein CM1200mP30_05030 [Pseudomonadota bacterium]
MEEGDHISINYDALISKMIVHADTRKNAIKAMRNALEQTAVIGVDTNLGFLQSIFLDGDFEESNRTLCLLSPLILFSKKKSFQKMVLWTLHFCFLKITRLKIFPGFFGPHIPGEREGNWRAGKMAIPVLLKKFKKVKVKEIGNFLKENSFQILNANGAISVSVSRLGKFFLN